ncbi:MAG: DegT/DnrJ/EryC1/StrS family aminotransferase [Candidatus Sumerlaeia bacterium]|nr:DegT/DnrJ/EryC1/StrS family aminotransferase [Candidatus Sumerlaeia bacterium]
MYSIPLTHTTLGEEEIEAANRVLRSGWLTMGEEVAAFETEFAQCMDIPHAIAVSNGTAALEISFAAAGIGPGDEVLLPSITFVACFNALVRLGAKPVLVDLESPHDLTLSPRKCAEVLNDKTRALVPMAHGGFPPDMGGLEKFAAENGLLIIEDSCHAPLAEWNGRKIGTFGLAATWSFFGNKNLTTGEGGMITTADDDFAARCRLMRSHGITRPTWDRARGHAAGYDVALVGTNARMDEIRAAIGRVQLARLPAATESRRAAAGEMYRCLDTLGIDGLVLPKPVHPGLPAWHLFWVLLPSGTNRGAVMDYLREDGIQTSVHYAPLHRFTATRDWFLEHGGLPDLPVTDAVAERLMTLPLGPATTTDEINRIAESLKRALDILQK